jgi:hypothetical protein
MNQATIRKKVSSKKEKILRLENGIRKIQAVCKHPDANSSDRWKKENVCMNVCPDCQLSW